MISPALSRKLMAKAASTTALFARGLDRIVVASVNFHANRLVASLQTASNEAERLNDHANIVQAAANEAYTKSALADVAVEQLAADIDTELAALGGANL